MTTPIFKDDLGVGGMLSHLIPERLVRSDNHHNAFGPNTMLQKVISRLSFLYCLLLLLLFADCSLPDAPTVENQNRQSIGVDSLNDFVTAEMETGTKVLRGCTPSENTPSDTAGREKMNGKTYL